jgi:hypothetical protein
MKLSVLWAPFFFVGLLCAYARVADTGGSSAGSARLARRSEIVHKIKVSIASPDTWIEAREPGFAEPKTPPPRPGSGP